MKRKVYIGVLLMCIMFAVSGCGGNAQKEESTSATDTEEVQTNEKETEANAKEQDSDEKPSSFGTRLVSVDNVDKYVTIGEYKGLSLDNTVEEVTDDQVEAQIEYELENKAEEVTDKKETVKEGDLVTINFVGTLDGKTFDGGTANNYDLTVGEGQMIDGFEDGIIGMKTGETKELNLTFPEGYPEASLEGKDVVFKVTLQKFRRAPELTDAWVAENTEVKTVQEYKESVRQQLTEQAKASANNTLLSTAWSTVSGNSEVKEYPEEDMENALAEFKNLYEQYAKQADMSLEEFIEAQGISMDAFEEQSQQYAELKVKQNLIVQGIMDKEGMALDDEESLAIQEQLIKDYNAENLAELVDTYGQAAVDESIGLLRVENFIVDHAEVNQLVSNGGLVGQSGDGNAEESENTDEENAGEDTASADNE